MKKTVTFLLIMSSLLMIISPCVADMTIVPTIVSPMISDYGASLDELMDANNNIHCMMSNLIMLDYCHYNPKYEPNYEHDSYIGLCKDLGLYFAIPDAKGRYYILLYSPNQKVLFFMGNDAIQKTAKDAEYLMRSSCTSYEKLASDDMMYAAYLVMALLQ